MRSFTFWMIESYLVVSCTLMGESAYIPNGQMKVGEIVAYIPNGQMKVGEIVAYIPIGQMKVGEIVAYIPNGQM